jgi:hypothetical protein
MLSDRSTLVSPFAAAINRNGRDDGKHNASRVHGTISDTAC